MTERVLWNFYQAEQVKDGGYVIVQRRCIDNPRAGALVSHHGTTTLHAYRNGKLEAQEEAKRRNVELGSEHVPYPFDQSED
jgi:hypothetical protein